MAEIIEPITSAEFVIHTCEADHFTAGQRAPLLARIARYMALAEQMAQLATPTQAVHQRSKYDLLTVLNVVADSQRYALPAQEIIDIGDNVSVAPDECLPMFDLGALLGVRGECRASERKLIIVGSEKRAALYVEAVCEMASIPADQLLPVLHGHDEARREHIQGALPDGALLLDLRGLLGKAHTLAERPIIAG